MTPTGRPPHDARAAAPRPTDTAGRTGPTTDTDGPVGPLARGLIAIIRGYQRWISPLLGPRCRFHPSCSAYAITALARHGALRGSMLAAWRLLRCHPFHPGGVDPVPEAPLGRRRRAASDPGQPGLANPR